MATAQINGHDFLEVWGNCTRCGISWNELLNNVYKKCKPKDELVQ